jgi:hypothetical protein
VDGDRVAVVDLETGDQVEGVIRAEVRYTPAGTIATMTWRVSGASGPGVFEPAGEAPEEAPTPARPLSREEILAAAGPDLPPDAPPFEDDDRPRPRRPLS